MNFSLKKKKTNKKIIYRKVVTEKMKFKNKINLKKALIKNLLQAIVHNNNKNFFKIKKLIKQFLEGNMDVL